LRAGRRRVDLAEVNGRIFINNSSVGIYPYGRPGARQNRDGSKWTAHPRLRPRARASPPAPDRPGSAVAAIDAVPFVGNNQYDLNFLSPSPLNSTRATSTSLRPMTKLGFLCSDPCGTGKLPRQ
jgi:hypothetical protein